jgi:hypothetical protein
MAFRTQAAVILIFLAFQGAGNGQSMAFRVRHNHLHKGGTGILTFTNEIVRWEEDKKPEHSRSWRFPEIQLLELSPDRVRILTYEDVGWQLGRDREYVFDHLPKDLAKQIHPLLTPLLDQRYLAHFAEPGVASQWETPAKLLIGRSGSNGVLKVGASLIVFDGGDGGESRTWRFADITSVNSPDPFELTLTTIEGNNRIQLKNILSEKRYEELWRKISEVHGLKVFHSSIQEHTH